MNFRDAAFSHVLAHGSPPTLNFRSGTDTDSNESLDLVYKIISVISAMKSH